MKKQSLRLGKQLSGALVSYLALQTHEAQRKSLSKGKKFRQLSLLLILSGFNLTGRFKIKTSSTQELYAELTGENPLTAKAFWNSLPIDGKANTWGDEIYFSIPIKMGSENPKEIVKLGDVAYWPPGQAICFFFGPTPASWNEDIRPASPVNVFARIEYNVKLLKLVHPGERITLEKT